MSQWWRSEKIECECGRFVHPGKWKQHRASAWCKHHKEIRRLTKEGVSKSEIGRRLGLSRNFVHTLYKRVEEQNGKT